MFASSIQPSIVSLFSSTGSDPLNLFLAHTDSSLRSDSLIHLLKDSSSLPTPPPPGTLISPPSIDENTPGYSLEQTVLHIQSPTVSTTFIQCPPINVSPRRLLGTGSRTAGSHHLGIKHPWVHIQVRNLGREWSFEIGLVDQTGRSGVVRCSTFQVCVICHLLSGYCAIPTCLNEWHMYCLLVSWTWATNCSDCQKQPRLKLLANSADIPLLHLPLSFPSTSSRPLTAWSTTALHLPPLLHQFSSLAVTADASDVEPIQNPRTVTFPSGHYSHVSYVKVYATCRLRRIWFSETGPSQKLPWEFELYGAE